MQIFGVFAAYPIEGGLLDNCFYSFKKKKFKVFFKITAPFWRFRCLPNRKRIRTKFKFDIPLTHFDN